ncbi:MAG: hypothetical protein NC399_02730 [Muribaculum sp.]|nr:hypothetical protein [Muribaculum sp.]
MANTQNKRPARGRIRRFLAFCILLTGLCAVCAEEKVYAEGAATGKLEDVLSGHLISIEAEMIRSGRDTCDIRVTVENPGENWEGTARLLVEPGRYRPVTAYDTVLSLPQGSTKQFVVRVPQESLEDMSGTVRVVLLDKKSNKSAEREFTRLLQQDASALSMGILSDAYSDLTYLDMGGETFYFQCAEYPIRLVELKQENLTELLDTLTFVVIDQYNTDVLAEEQTAAIERWVGNGGVLLVGTGRYAEDTLGGFDNLGIRCVDVHEPEESQQGAVYFSAGFPELAMAELEDVAGQYSIGTSYLAYVRDLGDGAVGVLPYAFTELGRLHSDYVEAIGQEELVMMILSEASSSAASRYSSYSSGHDSETNRYRLLGLLGNASNQLHFGALKAIVVLYVFFAGPILYLILRAAKKRELYWVMAPLTALVGIFLVFLAGRGFEVASTRVYSVAVENLDKQGNGQTYLHCYDANHREWDLRLAEGHEYAGPVAKGGGYNYSEDERYYHHIRKEGDALYFGINPSSNFEDGYFCVGGAGGGISGDLVCDDILTGWSSIGGTIRNETDRDFCYYAVVLGDTLYVFENLPAGETRSLSVSDAVYTNSNSWRDAPWSAYLYDYIDDIYDGKRKADLDAVAALGVGGCTVSAQNTSAAGMVIGVTKNWEKAVDDTCSEGSYACFYKVW